VRRKSLTVGVGLILNSIRKYSNAPKVWLMQHYWHEGERSLQQRYEKNWSWRDAAASAQTALRFVEVLRIPEGFGNWRQPRRVSGNDCRFARG